MKLKKSEEIENLISQLDKKLHEGWKICRPLIETYAEQIKGLSFDESKWLQWAYQAEHQWYSAVLQELVNNLGENDHHVYHFMRSQTKRVAFKYNGMSELASGFRVRFEDMLDALEQIILRLEEREGLVVRQETARVEKDNSLLYEMTYLGREIRINDILVAKPVFMSENDEFFAYIYERPWVKISIDEMKKDLQIADFKKSVASMLADLNITGSIRKIFAPNASAKAIEFRNPITRGFADKNKLPDLKLVDRSNKKE